jgi:hypothetical protein
MRTEHVRCISCGSRLEIPAEVRYIACHVCGTSLSVQHHQEGLSTAIVSKGPEPALPLRYEGDLPEPSDATERRVRELERRLDDLERENALLRLEHAWEEEREQYLIRTRNGGRVVPTVARTTLGLVMVSIVGGVLLLSALALGIALVISTAGSRGPLRGMRRLSGFLVPATFILFILAMTGVNSYLNRKKAHAYQKAHARYQAERDRLLGYDSRGPRRDD